MTVKNMFEKFELTSLMILGIFSGYKVTKGYIQLILAAGVHLMYRFRCN